MFNTQVYGSKRTSVNYIDDSTKREVIDGDALKELKKMEDGKYDLIVTSPPCNIGKYYEIKTIIENHN